MKINLFNCIGRLDFARNYKQLSTENQLSEKIIGCAIQVDTLLGPGFCSMLMRNVFFNELNNLGYRQNKLLPLIYKDVKNWTLDRLRDFGRRKIVELKSYKL